MRNVQTTRAAFVVKTIRIYDRLVNLEHLLGLPILSRGRGDSRRGLDW
jgi:hypothetical protein